MQLHLSKRMAELADQRRQAPIECAADIAYAQAAGLPCRRFARALQRLFGLLQRRARLHQQRLPRRGQAQRAVAAHDQSRAHFVFQAPHRRRQWRLRHVQACSGAMEVQFFGHRHELAEQAQIDHFIAGRWRPA
ncbi:hypothetical protein SRABI89_05546 [Pseudomonas koreensis]|nr:hypothetical protein SRABI89_05546 [Pseudomonas koreensis]